MDNCKSCGARYAGLSSCEYCGRFFHETKRKVPYIDTSVLSKEDIKHLIISYKQELLKTPVKMTPISMLMTPTSGARMKI